jgi:hypothetical protein
MSVPAIVRAPPIGANIGCVLRRSGTRIHRLSRIEAAGSAEGLPGGYGLGVRSVSENGFCPTPSPKRWTAVVTTKTHVGMPVPVFNLVGSTLSSATARACGLCGEIRKLSRAHVPPQSAGNTTKVLRAPDVIVDGVRRPGRWAEGGMWVRGLCENCNNRAGITYDVPYADLADQVARLSTRVARRLAVIPGEPPGATFAPGLASRAVLFGMFAINPRLRVLFPELAHNVQNEPVPSHGPIRWPDQLALKVGLTHPDLPNSGVLSSGVWAMRVIHERVVHFTFGDIVFPPLMWSLVPTTNDSERDGLGPQITKPLPDVTEWVKYGPDRTSVDLRSLVPTLPAIAHPMLARTNDWVELMTNDGSDADAIVVFGRRP